MNSNSSSGEAVSDPLSDVLSLLEVQSFLSRRLETSGSWALRFPDYQHMKFGGIIEGSRWIWIEGVTKPLKLDPGDFYLLSHGGPYCFASDPDVKPTDGLAFMAEHLQSDGVIRFDGGEGRSVGTGGRFAFNDQTSGLLLTSLPPLIHIRANAPHARALRAALDLITFETETQRMGGAAIGEGLCSVVLVNILRAHLSADDHPRGWLGALSDRRIGASLKLMHGDVARRWTVSGLASEVGMSRTSFAERFKSLVGMAPLKYLTRWRMTLARQALRREDANLTTIAASIGYESDTAFSLAFKRRFGGSPGRYRLHNRTAPEPLRSPQSGVLEPMTSQSGRRFAEEAAPGRTASVVLSDLSYPPTASPLADSSSEPHGWRATGPVSGLSQETDRSTTRSTKESS